MSDGTYRAGTTLACRSADPQFVRVVRALRGFGWLSFRIDPQAPVPAAEQAACQALTVKIDSAVLPGQLDQLP